MANKKAAIDISAALRLLVCGTPIPRFDLEAGKVYPILEPLFLPFGSFQ